MLRNLCIAVLALPLASCGSDQPSGNRPIAMSQSAMHARIAALAECPSPLNRLGIGRITPRLFIGSNGDVDFVIPSAEDAEGIAVRFDLGGDESGGGTLYLSWKVELSDTARELDLGEDRLLNPAKLAKELEAAVDSYMGYYQSAAQSDSYAGHDKNGLKAACNKFGRVVDAIAATTNPNLRKTIEKQKRRDALGWLFKDNYKLRTESPSNGGWDSGGDY